MWKKITTLCIVGFNLLLAGCSWQLANQSVLGDTFKTMRLQSNQPYDFLSREVRQQLRLHQVTVVDKGDVPELRIKGTNINSTVVSVFRQGREAENVLKLTVSATVYIPGKGEFPVNVGSSRTFFDDSRAALAKSAEKEVIYNDMLRQAAKQLMIKLSSLNNQLAQ